jgi:hypothetical protein
MNPHRFQKPDVVVPLEMNSARPEITLPEYGRNIQKMVQYSLSLEDRDERARCCKAIISVMGQLFPYLRDMEDFNHKLWDHLHIMSDFRLDVDSPYPKPEPSQFVVKPNRIAYPQEIVKFGHYGRYVEKMIDKCVAMEEGEERMNFTISIATLMKQNALNWNRATITDDVILEDLKYLSAGKLSVENIQEIHAVKTIQGSKYNDFVEDSYRNNKKRNNNNNKKKKFKKKY